MMVNMKGVFRVLSEVPEYKKVISVISILLFPLIPVCAYGILIGGSCEELACLIFILVVSLILSLLIGLFMFGKKFSIKEIRLTKVCILLFIIISVLHFVYYSSINVTFVNSDDVKECEVAILKIENVYGAKGSDPYGANLYFTGSDGEEYYVFFDYFLDSTDNVLPFVSGNMIVKETRGAFNYYLYEFVKITSK